MSAIDWQVKQVIEIINNFTSLESDFDLGDDGAVLLLLQSISTLKSIYGENAKQPDSPSASISFEKSEPLKEIVREIAKADEACTIHQEIEGMFNRLVDISQDCYLDKDFDSSLSDQFLACIEDVRSAIGEEHAGAREDWYNEIKCLGAGQAPDSFYDDLPECAKEEQNSPRPYER